MPTYNGTAFLGEQIDSIRSQTMADFELLCMDDGSDDDTVAMIERAAAGDHRIVLCPAIGNKGQAHRLTELVALARAPLLCVADQDDVWDADKNRLLMDAIGDRPLAFGRSELIDGTGARLGLTLLDAIGSTPEPDMRLRALFRPMVSGHGMIVRRDWLDPASFVGAVPFDMALAQEALFCGGLAYCREAVVLHRLHGGNQMNGGANRKRTGGRWSRARAIQSLSAAAPARLQLWLSLDQLGRSSVLAPALRATMRRLAVACHGAWFSPWRNSARARRIADLRTLLWDALAPLAGSDVDRHDFGRRLDLITQSAWHPARLADGWARYRGQME